MPFLLLGLLLLSAGLLLWRFGSRRTTRAKGPMYVGAFVLVFVGLPLIPLGLLVLTAS